MNGVNVLIHGSACVFEYVLMRNIIWEFIYEYKKVDRYQRSCDTIELEKLSHILHHDGNDSLNNNKKKKKGKEMSESR